MIGFCAMALPQLAALADTAGIISGTVTDDRTHRPIAGVAGGCEVAERDVPHRDRREGSVPVPERAARQLLALVLVQAATRRIRSPWSCSTARSRPSTCRSPRRSRRSPSTHARSSGSAFQRGMTIDTYTVTGSQIETVQGKAFNANEQRPAAQHSQRDDRQDRHGLDSRRLRLRGGLRVRGHRLHHAVGKPAEHAAERRELQPAQRRGQRAADSRRRRRDARRHGHRPRALHRQERNVPDVSARRHRGAASSRTFTSWASSGAGPTPAQRLSNYAGFIGIRRAFQYGMPGTAANTLGTLGTNAATLGSTIDPNLVYYAPSFLERRTISSTT